MIVQNDKALDVALGNSRKTKKWKNRTMLWSELLDRLANVTRTPETVAEYRAMSRNRQAEIKDVGGFVGGLARSSASSDLPSTRITGCSANADITATWYGGGFAGSANLPIAGCSADGTLTIAVRPNASIPSNIGGFSGDMLFTLTNCHSGVEIFYEVPGANRMGSFVGEASGFDRETVAIIDCTIDADAVHEGWLMVGWKAYTSMTEDITIVNE